MVTKLVEASINELERLHSFAVRDLGYEHEIPDLSFGLSGTCAGIAHGRFNLIELNPYIMEHIGMLFVRCTVGHEFAHIMALRERHCSGHGMVWQRYMDKLGMSDKSSHHDYNIAGYSLGPRRHMRWLYVCVGCGMRDDTITTRRKNSWEREGLDMICSECDSWMEIDDGKKTE